LRESLLLPGRIVELKPDLQGSHNRSLSGSR
jgi:hypothetical protein